MILIVETPSTTVTSRVSLSAYIVLCPHSNIKVASTVCTPGSVIVMVFVNSHSVFLSIGYNPISPILNSTLRTVPSTSASTITVSHRLTLPFGVTVNDLRN